MDEIHRALAENLVILFRHQHITAAAASGLGRKFGELHIRPRAQRGRGPGLMKIYADND